MQQGYDCYIFIRHGRLAEALRNFVPLELDCCGRKMSAYLLAVGRKMG
jgi:hypothetical protein